MLELFPIPPKTVTHTAIDFLLFYFNFNLVGSTGLLF